MADAPSEDLSASAPASTVPDTFDTRVAHIARVYDYWLGGKDNYAADRAAAEQVIAAYPTIRTSVRAQRAFLGRAVHYLAADEGIRQFLDIGTGLPSANNTHEVAQRTAPDARVVYVDKDPIVLSHARALLTGSPQGATEYVDADLRDTSPILEQAAVTLDFRQPMAVMLIGVLHCIPDDDDPPGIVARLMDAVPPGSHLIISHPAADIQAEAMAAGSALLNEALAAPVTFRNRGQVARLFGRLDLVEPGLVSTSQWRSSAGAKPLNVWAGVARKT